MQISNEEAKSIEISKLQKVLESLSLELDASKLATINECNKNAVLQNQLELSVKEKSSLEREIIGMAELRRENAFLKVSFLMFVKLCSYVSFTLGFCTLHLIDSEIISVSGSKSGDTDIISWILVDLINTKLRTHSFAIFF